MERASSSLQISYWCFCCAGFKLNLRNTEEQKRLGHLSLLFQKQFHIIAKISRILGMRKSFYIYVCFCLLHRRFSLRDFPSSDGSSVATCGSGEESWSSSDTFLLSSNLTEIQADDQLDL